MSKPVVYVSGPMRGQPNDNFETFNDVAEMLEGHGYEALNPASKGHLTEGYTWQDAMRTDISWVTQSDYICLLPGWEQSEGARLEVAVARAVGLKFLQAINVEGRWESLLINTPSAPSVEGIDAEARRLVYGARAQTYGHPRGDFDTIGTMWAGILASRANAIAQQDRGFWERLKDRVVGRNAWADLLTAEVVAIMMSALKLARLSSSPDHRDSQVDTIGYMLCLARIQEDPAELSAWEGREPPRKIEIIDLEPKGGPDYIVKFDQKINDADFGRRVVKVINEHLKRGGRGIR